MHLVRGYKAQTYLLDYTAPNKPYDNEATGKKQKVIEPVHEISNNVVCATSKASDQPVHTCSLIRGFACRLHSL